MREHYGKEPDIDRRSLALWMPLSLAVAAVLLWLGLDLQPPGHAASIQTVPASPMIGAMGFAYLLSWAAFAYGISIGGPHESSTKLLLVASLLLPIAAVLALDYGITIGALLLAVVWLAALTLAAFRIARREPLGGLMFLPLIGSAVTSLLLTLTYWHLG
jgi:hypothetical protein